MNAGLELHDSTLASVTSANGAVVILLSPAYIHRSEGQPGIDAGSGWLQDATLTIPGSGDFASPAELPIDISDGFLRIGESVHNNMLPAGGHFVGAIELSLTLANSETVVFRGTGIEIQMQGDAKWLEHVPAF